MRDLAAHLDSLVPAISDARAEQSAERARNDATVQHLKKLREEHRLGVRRSASGVPQRAGDAPAEEDGGGLLCKEGYLCVLVALEAHRRSSIPPRSAEPERTRAPAA